MEVVNVNTVKKHWPIIAGSVIGLIVLYYIVKHLGPKSGTPAAAPSGSSQLASYQAAADLANNQVNGQVAIASYQAATQDNSIAASLQASLADTAAKLSASNTKVAADAAVAMDLNQTNLAIAKVNAGAAETINAQNVSGAVSTAQIQADAAVSQTAIQGATLQGLASTAASVKLAQISDVNKQISTLMQYSKHFGSDIKAIAPVIYAETGQGGAGASVAASNAQTDVAKSPGATITSVAGGITSILSGLFA